MQVSDGMSTHLHASVRIRRCHLHQPLHHEDDILSPGEEYPETALWGMW